MTEKDFRKIVTELELTKQDKEEIDNFINDFFNLLKTNIKYFNILEIKKISSLLDGTYYHGKKRLDLMVLVDMPKVNSYPLMNKALINEIWNFLIFNYNIEKVSQLTFDEKTNSITVNILNKELSLYVRFKDKLNYQTGFNPSDEIEKAAFVNLATKDFTLFKNAIQLISYYKDEANLNFITDYMIELLMYYGLSENFQKHTYELYLKEVVHSIDDLIKGIKIDQDDQTYLMMNKERVNLPKSQYMIIDIVNPLVNLADSFGEAAITEFKKLKKLILKLLENKA